MNDEFAQDEFSQLHCDVCGHSFTRDDLVDFQGSTMCGPCKRETVGRLEAGQAPMGSGSGNLPPWERRDELGWVAGFFLTVKEVVVEPGAFFERMDKTATTKDCLGFAALVTLFSAGTGWLLQTAIVGLIGAAGSAAGGTAEPLMAMFGMQGVAGCVAAVFAPLMAVFAAYLVAGCVHLFLAVTKNVGVPFQQTLRGVCYGMAPGVLQGIPIVGAAAGIYAMVCQIFMVMRFHRVSGGVATLSVLWLTLFGCCLGFGVVAMVLGAGASGAF